MLCDAHLELVEHVVPEPLVVQLLRGSVEQPQELLCHLAHPGAALDVQARQFTGSGG